MNERIAELMVQAGITTNLETDLFDDEGNIGKWLDHFAEEFAELIVRDCLSIVENNNPRPPGTTIMYSLDKDEYFDTGWQVAVETKLNQIKEHFGVV